MPATPIYYSIGIEYCSILPVQFNLAYLLILPLLSGNGKKQYKMAAELIKEHSKPRSQTCTELLRTVYSRPPKLLGVNSVSSTYLPTV